MADVWDHSPFFVINSDIVTDIDLKSVYKFHLNHCHPVTLVLKHDNEFNTVSVDNNGFITDFNQKTSLLKNNNSALTFTGIQVLDPDIIKFIPEDSFSSSIDLYRKLIRKNRKIYAFISNNDMWKDIGTPDRYKEAVFNAMAPIAFKQAFSDFKNNKIKRIKLKGDGSDRKWYRLTSDNQSLIMVDHDIKNNPGISEADAFVTIGKHLYGNGLPVPEIYLYDTFPGIIFLKDLGDVNLQTFVQNSADSDRIIKTYKSVIRILVKLSVLGSQNFNPAWTYPSTGYNADFIIEKECNYFVNSFLKGYMGVNVTEKTFDPEFILLAHSTLKFAINGFMHRDMQSRNIMVKNNQFYFIDFQQGRLGPIQYDLASLLIDPYVQLPRTLQKELVDYCFESLTSLTQTDRNQFYSGYKYCAITRNLQILGAFGYLSRVKKKIFFEKYIPKAVKTLRNNLSDFEKTEFAQLLSITEKIDNLISL